MDLAKIELLENDLAAIRKDFHEWAARKQRKNQFEDDDEDELPLPPSVSATKPLRLVDTNVKFDLNAPEEQMDGLKQTMEERIAALESECNAARGTIQQLSNTNNTLQEYVNQLNAEYARISNEWHQQQLQQQLQAVALNSKSDEYNNNNGSEENKKTLPVPVDEEMKKIISDLSKVSFALYRLRKNQSDKVRWFSFSNVLSLLVFAFSVNPFPVMETITDALVT